MIQAKDYHGDSRVDVGKMNEHAEKNADEVLDGVFGKTRMLCVASTADAVLGKGATKKKRDHLPYLFHRGKLVEGLLKKLQTQRDPSARVEKYASFVDKFGVEVKRDVRADRKRKIPPGQL